jgi:hypothetical protein
MNYEVLDLLEVGSAGSTIREKGVSEFDEHMDPGGFAAEALEE